MLTENVMISFLRKFDEYPFIVKLKGKEYRIGDGDPAFTVIFHKEIPLTALTTSTSLALGEAYMDGDLEIEGDLYNALDHFLGQMGKFSTDESALKKLIFSSTGKKNQEKEVQSHYDIGNDFYKLWLDETMSYSCGYFLHEDDSLYQAQVNKVDYILKKLHLSQGMSLLDIGCGWGFLLIEAAKKYGVHGMGITLSREQYEAFNRRIKEQNLGDLLEVALMDYRAAFYGLRQEGSETGRPVPAPFHQRAERTRGRSLDQKIYLPGRRNPQPAGDALLRGGGRFPYPGRRESAAPL